MATSVQQVSHPDLTAFAADVYSQDGEDGILDQILHRLAVSHDLDRWCVEVGAWDGVHLSNTAHLIRSGGYRAVLIEPRPGRFRELSSNHPSDPIHKIRAFVGLGRHDRLDAVLAATPVAATATNLVFVATDLVPAVVGDHKPALADLRDDASARCLVFFGFDGSVHTSRDVVLPWHGSLRVTARRLQVLPRPVRRYPGGVGVLHRALILGSLAVRDAGYRRRFASGAVTRITGNPRKAHP